MLDCIPTYEVCRHDNIVSLGSIEMNTLKWFISSRLSGLSLYQTYVHCHITSYENSGGNVGRVELFKLLKASREWRGRY